MARSAALVAMFRRLLELCKLEKGQTVSILTSGRKLIDYADAFAAAANEEGARAFHIDIPSVIEGRTHGGVAETSLAPYPMVVNALKQSDMVIDLMYLLWSPELLDMRRSGSKVLLCVEPIDVLMRLFPNERLKRQALAASALLRSAKRLRVTSPAGTDISYEIGQYEVHEQYGLADVAGRWDHFPGTFVAAMGNDGTVNGKVVIQPGDILLPFRRYVNSPIELTIRRNVIERIEGGADAKILRDYLQSFDDDRAFATSHIGWGLDERARWDALMFETSSMGMDARSKAGSVMFATGPNLNYGGDNDTAAHVDIPMLDCSFYVDDRLVVDRGRIIVDFETLVS